MRIFRILLPFLLTVVVIVLLDRPIGSLPALGRLLDPVNGAIANAEPVSTDFNQKLALTGLQKPVSVWLDDRLVPHIHADNDRDLYFTQGYIHAYFRLWQMDMQTRAAGGRISEVAGEKALNFDIGQRRKGMVYAAENSLRAMEAEPRTKTALDAYRDGINAYRTTLSYRQLPLEYKLMGFKPEPWTNIKTALLMKYMADDLTGYTEDIPLTYLRDRLPKEEFDLLFPEKIPGSKHVIPSGTLFWAPLAEQVGPPGNPDSLFAHFPDSKTASVAANERREEQAGIGSNSWVVSGVHTTSSAPILSNDPHLTLNLPSLWFEMQLQAPGVNVYGVSLPGAPGIVIGFNDSVSWGLTNNYRDVKDYYEIHPADAGHYWFDGQKRAYQKRIETITLKGGRIVKDTVLYTIHGPIQYDVAHPDPSGSGLMLAMCWTAHRATNELLALYEVNRAQNFEQFRAGAYHFECPAQNFAYADRAGNIAELTQGRYINKWFGQGRFVMEGHDSRTLWGDTIPMRENPMALNPAQGFLVGANQSTTDSTYPHWYNGTWVELRAWRINQCLQNMLAQHPASVADMQKLQQDVVSLLAENMLPFANFYNRYFAEKQAMNTVLTPQSNAAFQIWWAYLLNDIWKDEFADVPAGLMPLPERTMQLLLSDTTLRFYDDMSTPQKETLNDMLVRSFQQTADSLEKLKKTVGTEWYKVKNTTINHLTKIPAFSYAGLKVGGWGNTINAVKSTHGPSWRMIVEMGKDSIHAVGVYPGGPSGNPGSPWYANMLQHWVEGQYYNLLFLPNAVKQNNPHLRYTWTLSPQ